MKKIFCAVFVLVFVFIGVYFINPELRVKCFVEKHSDEYAQWDGYPNNIGINYSNVWTNDKGQTMHEMILFSIGGTFYGCYYSPADVPFAFQSLDYELVADGDGKWEWSGNDGRRGETSKIKDNWYYFKAIY